MIILFGGKEYAVGLSWFSISSPDEIDQFKREMDLSHGVVKLSKVEGMPSAVALSPPEYDNQVSLAAALSYAHENLLYVCKTEYKDEAQRQQYYFCCVKRGLVTVGGDVMGDIDTVLMLYAQGLQDLRNDIHEDNIECLGTDVDDRFESVHPVDATQVVTSIQRFENQCVIKELRKGGPSKLAAGLMVVCLVGLGYFAYDWFFKKPPPPPPPPPPTQEAAAPAPPPEDPFDQFMDTVDFNKTVTTAALPLIEDVLKQIPLRINGWDVTSITITLGENITFSIGLERMPFATMMDIKNAEASGVIKDLDLPLGGASATATWPGSVEKAPLLTKEALASTKDAPKNQIQLTFMNVYQSNNLQLKVDAPTDTAGYASRHFIYEGKGLWGLDGFNDVFGGLTTLGIVGVTVKPSKGVYEWTIEGIVYG